MLSRCHVRAGTPAQVQAAGRQRPVQSRRSADRPGARATLALRRRPQALDFERERMRRIRLDFSLTRRGCAGASQAADSGPLRRGIRRLGRGGTCSSTMVDRRPHALLQSRAVEPVPPERGRASRAARSSTPPWTDGPDGDAPTRITAKCATQALATRQARSVAPRRVRVTHSLTVNAGCRAGRRDGARLAAVSARAPGSAGRHAPASRARRRSTPSRPSRRCSAPCTSSSRPRRASRRSFRSPTS